MRAGKLDKRLWRVFFFILMLPEICLSTSGQQKQRFHDQYRFRALTVDDGLNNNRVRAILQDAYGFMWFGTRTGISKFDGYNIYNYDFYFIDTICTKFSQLRELICDSYGNIWAGGEDGMCTYNPDKDRFENFNDPDFPGRITKTVGIAEDHDGIIWFTNANEIARYNPVTKKFTWIKPAPGNSAGLPAGSPERILVDKNNDIWIGYQNEGVAFCNRKENKFIHYTADGEPGSLGENLIERIYEDDQGTIWIGFNNKGFSRFDRNTKQFTTYFPDPDNPESGRVRGILKDSKGHFWIGTMSGLYLFDEINEKFTWYAHTGHPVSELSHNSIQCIVQDNQEGLWLGTHAGGVCYTNLNTSGFTRYDYSPIQSPYFLNDKNVYSLAVDHQGNIWVGTEKGGLNYLNRETGKFTYYVSDLHHSNTPLSNNIKDIIIDARNNVWFATYGGGFSYLDTESDKFTHYMSSEQNPDGFPVSRIYIIYLDPIDEDILWLGTINGLYSYHIKTGKYEKITANLPGYINSPETNSQIYTINSCQNKLIIGTDHLIILDLQKRHFTTFSEIEGIPVSSVNFVLIDQKQNIWFDIDNTYLVSSDSGFNEFKVIGPANGLPDFDYYEASDDRQGNLWLSSNKGIVQLLDIINNQDTVKTNVFTKSDNLQSIEFLYHSKAVSPDGEIFFGGINGFNSFYPEKVVTNQYPPRVHITGLLAGNSKVSVNQKVFGKVLLDKPVIETKNIDIHHRIRVFTLEFVGLHYISPENNNYAYILEGYDEQWNLTNASVRFASYSNLPGGTYYFKVKAANKNGLWSEENVLKIIVKPAFWETWYFYTILSLFVLGMIIFLIRRRESQLRKDKSTLEEKLQQGDIEIDRRKAEIEKQQRAIEEKEKAEEYYNWVNQGLALISDILNKEKNDLPKLSQSLISNIVKYLEAQQGGLFLSDTTGENNTSVELMANYAYNSERLEKTSFDPGEGLVGTCFQQKKILEIDDLPDTYAKLNSGLGEDILRHLLLIPLIYDNEAFGVIEIVSFYKIDKLKVDFAVRISENIASVISSVKSNNLIREMLLKTQEQSEELHAQEEEMRQTIEEMQTAQEDISLREKSLQDELKRLRKQVQELTAINKEQKKK
jgi:ligand-binding sensor domain-containing protein